MKVYVKIPTLSTCSLQVPFLKSSVTWLVSCQSYNSPSARFLMVRTLAGDLEYQLAIQNTSQLATLNTSHQYSIFHLQQKCRLYIFTYSTSIHRVDGSILAGVFLSSFIVLCLGLHIPPMQRVAAYRQLGPTTALVHLVVPSQQWLHSKPTTLEEAATETGSCSASLTPCELLLGSPKNSPQTLSPQRSHSTES